VETIENSELSSGSVESRQSLQVRTSSLNPSSSLVESSNRFGFGPRLQFLDLQTPESLRRGAKHPKCSLSSRISGVTMTSAVPPGRGSLQRYPGTSCLAPRRFVPGYYQPVPPGQSHPSYPLGFSYALKNSAANAPSRWSWMGIDDLDSANRSSGTSRSI
ncbi:MAG: hypothetical protein QOE88_2729, partial [Verrucomicrobiota bacterium]|nr:hypothetical protein [Verrucomicrobiota bacterium]